MRLFKLIPLLILLTFAFPLSGYGNTPFLHESLGDIKTVQDSGTLRIGILEKNVPPFVFTKDGQPAGYEVDICRGMAAVLKVEPEFVKIPGSYNDVVDAVAKGIVDIAVSQLTKTARRSRFVYFSEVYFATELSLAVSRRSLTQSGVAVEPGKTDKSAVVLSRLKDMAFTLVTMGGTQSGPILRQMFPLGKIEFTDSWDEAALRVYRGQADVAFMTSASFEIAAHNDPKLLYKLAELKLDVHVPMAMAISPEKPQLARWINDYLAANVLTRKLSTRDLIKKYLFDDEGRPIRAVDAALPQQSLGLNGGMGNVALVVGMHLGIALLFWLGVVRKSGKSHWLLSPWAVLGGMTLGGATGLVFPELAEFFSRPAAVYMGFWRMCVLPIMIGAIVTSVYKLLSGGDNTMLLKRLLIFTPLLLLAATAFGMGFGILGQPGMDFPEEAQKMLVVDMGGERQSQEPMGMYEVVVQMVDKIVPDNLFVPLVENQSLAVLFIAVFFGISLAGSASGGKSAAIDILEAVLEAFTKMIKFSLYLLPFALYALALEFMAETGLELLMAIMKLVVFLCLGMIPACVFTFWALNKRLGLPARTIFKDFGPIFLLSFSTRSSVITMPIGLEAMGRCHQVDKNQTMAAFPFALLICHYPRAVFYSMIPVFISQAFDIDLNLGQYLLMALMAMLATIAAIGSIGTYVFLLPIVCTPLGLPVEPAILIGMGVTSLLNPLIAAIQAVFGCGVTTMLVEKSEGTQYADSVLQPECP